jgi:hypothetical protein
MSSLAAARADNFYYPPGFDPDKHGSLNKVRKHKARLAGLRCSCMQHSKASSLPAEVPNTEQQAHMQHSRYV